MKETFKLMVVGLFGVFVGGAIVTALTVDEAIPSLQAYLQTLFLTDDGTPSWTTNIIIDGRDGSITMQGDLNINQGALKDNTVISADIANGTIKAEDIGAWEVVNANLAPNSVTSDKIVDGTITVADLNANIDVSSASDGKEIKVDYAREAWSVNGTVDKAKEVVSPNGTVVAAGADAPYLGVPWGITFWWNQRASHINDDGAFYRYNGQVYLTVDDYLYIRDTDGNVVWRTFQYGGSAYLQIQDWKSLYIKDLGGANIAKFWPNWGLSVYNGSQRVTIWGNYIDLRTDRGPRVEYAWNWRISAWNNPDTAFAKKLAWAMVALRGMYSSCVKVSWLSEEKRTADRWGNSTNPDAFSRRYRIRCYY